MAIEFSKAVGLVSTITKLAQRMADRSAEVKINEVAINLQGIVLDDARLESILKSHLKISLDEWSKLQTHELWVTGEEAIKNGIADEVGEFSPPKGQQLISFTL